MFFNNINFEIEKTFKLRIFSIIPFNNIDFRKFKLENRYKYFF